MQGRLLVLPIRIDPIEPESKPRKRTGTSSVRTSKATTSYETSNPEEWEIRIDRIAATVRTFVTKDWHAMYMAMSGALIRRGVDPERVPQLIWEISNRAGSVKPESHRKSAQDTVDRYYRGIYTTGLGALNKEWPSVGLVVNSVLRTTQAAAAPQEDHKIVETVEKVRDSIRKVSASLVLVSTECGLGKTRAAIDVAVERAAVQMKTAISCRTNALAVQVTADLRARGVTVRRIFGPLSVEGPDECIHRDRALPLISGGQSLHREFCEGRKGQSKCDAYDTCTIREGYEGGDDGYYVIVGNHAQLGELVEECGQKGLLIIDEPPEPVTSEPITDEDFKTLDLMKDAFAKNYVTCMQRVVDIAEMHRDENPERASDIFWGIELDWAFPPNWRGTAPHLKSERIGVIRSRFTKKNSKKEGIASRVYNLLYETVKSDSENTKGTAIVRYVKGSENSKNAFVITRMNYGLEKAILRVPSPGGGTVILDANASTHAKMYEKIVGYPLTCDKFGAVDKSPIERTRVQIRSARSKWIPGGRLDIEEVGTGFKILHEWIYSGPSNWKYGLITFKPIALAMKAVHGEDVKKDWIDRWGVLEECVTQIRENLGPEGTQAIAEIAWYGAIRGMNGMKDLDGIVTMGDPWNNVDATLEAARFVGLDGWDVDEYQRACCEDELEQAQGRLRVVHRTRPGRSLHLGHETPGGTGWTRPDVIVAAWDERGGHNKNQDGGMSKQELQDIRQRFKSTSEFAACVGVSERTMKNYLYTSLIVPPDIVDIIRKCTPIGDQSTSVVEQCVKVLCPSGSKNGGAVQLAKVLGVSHRTIMNWLSGSRCPSKIYVETMNKILRSKDNS